MIPLPRSFRPGAVAGLLLASLAAAGSGCAPGEQGSDGLAVRDSAGITILENPNGAVEAAPRWGVGPEPMVEIGSVDRETGHAFGSVGGAVVLSDGRIVVGTGRPPELRAYDARGSHLRSAGGGGEGPGEFERISSLDRLTGDTLLVFDTGLDRASYFGPDLAFVRSVRLRPRSGLLAGQLEDGTLVTYLTVMFRRRPADGMHRAESILLAHGPEGRLRDTLLVRPGRALYAWSTGRSFAMTVPPVTTAAHAAADSTGLYTAHGRAWEYTLRRSDGTVERIVRLDRPRRRVTEAERDSLLEERLADIGDPRRRKRTAGAFREMPATERHPAFDRLAIGPGGTVWLREREGGGETPDRWIVFGADGRVRAVALLPPRFQPTEINRGTVVGQWRDELDVQHVRVYRIRR